MGFEQDILNFQVSVYGALEQFNEVLSKARVRIFYKYSNRNGTYITDEFADKLISTLPYTPVKGIYDDYNDDYTDHGEKRNEGRIYGIVPETPNFAWEKHLDEDGVEREYACCDVLIFTGLYEEARQIINKPQSMELFKDSIRGEWKVIAGRKQYVFTDGCFLGLQVLGEETEPCFEGASFYSLADTLKSLIEKIEKYTNSGGKKKVNTLNFKLSNSQVFNAIFALLNSNYTEEGGWAIEYSVMDVYNDYAIAYKYETGDYERVYYTKNNETDSVELGERVKVFILDVTEEEKKTLEAIQAVNGGTYEKADEVFSSLKERVAKLEGEAAAFEEKTTEYDTKVEELNGEIATLNTEKDGLSNDLEAAQTELATLKEENATLVSFRDTTIRSQKEAVIAEYSEILGADVLENFTNRIDEFADAESLDKELAYTLKKSGGFSKTPHYTPKEQPTGGIADILSKYKK